MKKLKRPLSILLSVLMVVSLFTVVPFTASAAPTESLLITIYNEGNADFVSGSFTFDNIATVTFSDAVDNDDDSDGWYNSDSSDSILSVAPAAGYTITKVKFYGTNGGSVFDETSPFEATLNDYDVFVNESSCGFGGVTKIEVYGYAAPPAPTYTMTCTDALLAPFSVYVKPEFFDVENDDTWAEKGTAYNILSNPASDQFAVAFNVKVPNGTSFNASEDIAITMGDTVLTLGEVDDLNTDKDVVVEVTNATTYDWYTYQIKKGVLTGNIVVDYAPAPELPEAIKDCTYKQADSEVYANVPFKPADSSGYSSLLHGAIDALFQSGTIQVIDAKEYSYKFYDQTGTEIAATLSNSAEIPGSKVGLGDGVTVYRKLFDFTLPENFEKLYIVATEAVGDSMPENEYLTFTAVEAGASVTLKVASGSNLQYSLDGGELIPYTPGTQITFASAGDYVRFRGKDTTFNSSNYVSIGGKVACSGNVMSLRLDDNGRDQGLSDRCFIYMFRDCTGLTAAPELPETTLAPHCYDRMFNDCTSLTAAPALPATTLAEYCYNCMFSGCISLTTAPALPATMLASNCYNSMFLGCESLTTAPELPATSLADYCYDSMFYGCSSIKLSETKTDEYSIPYSVPSGGNGTTAENALKDMFAGTGGTFTGTPTINTTYYLYKEVPKYTVTWKNWDGNVIKTDENVAKGTIPEYNGTTPVKDDDATYTYTFSGWSPEVTEVTGDAEYTATFTPENKAVKNVITLINALPAKDDLTLAHEEQIKAARAAYIALSFDEKKLVPEDSFIRLSGTEVALNSLKRGAFSQYRGDQADSFYIAMDQKIGSYDEAELMNALQEAISAIQNVSYDFEKSLAENKAAVDAAVQAQTEVMNNKMTEVCNAYKAKKIAEVQGLAQAGDSAAVIQILDNAVQAIDAVSYDTSKTYVENKAAVDAAVDIAQITQALAAQRNADKAAAVTAQINALPAEITLNDKAAVEAAKQAYDALTDEQRALVDGEAYNKLVGAMNTIEKAADDQAAADPVINQINALPAEITLNDKAAVQAARQAYEALTDDQKARVAPETLDKLTAAETAIADREAAKTVTDQINALPTVIILEDKADVEAARAAYNALTDDQKVLVAPETLEKLADAEKVIADREGAKVVEDMINALPDAKDITLADKAAVNAANEARLNLPPEQADYLTFAAIDKLFKAMDKIEDLEAAKAVEDQINALPENITVEDKEAVEAARAAFDALTDDQRALVDVDALSEKLAAAEAALKVVLDKAAADAVIAQIDALPAATRVTINDKDAIEAASAAYDALTDDQKDYVPLYSKLKLTLDKGALDAAIKNAEDEAAADAVEKMIEELPAAADVTLDDKTAIEEARAAYDALTNAQNRMVNLTDRVKLTADEAAIQKIENDIAAADAVTEQINALPAAEDVTMDDARDIITAAAAYNLLTPDQKPLVTEETIQKLKDAQDGLRSASQVEIVKEMINELPAAEDVTLADKEDIETVRDAYDALTDAQKEKIDDETLQKLTDAEAALEQAEADKEAADAVAAMIEALHGATEVTLNDKDAIEAASAAYDELTDAQKDYVPTQDKIKLALDKAALEAAQKFADDEAAADAVEELIEALPAPDEITLDDKAAVEEAKDAYDALTPDQKRLVVLTDRIKLALDQAAIQKIENDIIAAQAVTDMINALPAAEDVTPDDANAITAATAAYNALTPDQKPFVTDETVQKLTDAQNALAKLEEAQKVKDQINALPAPEKITVSDKDAIEAARAAYDALDDAQKAQIDDDTVKKLTDAEAALKQAEDDKAAADAVTEKIEALPMPTQVTLDDKAAIEEAKAAYDALTDAQKDYVPVHDALKLAFDEVALSIAETNAVRDMINALPATDDLTEADKPAVEAARKAYNDLTDEQKNLIDEDTLKKLTDAEEKLGHKILLGDANGDGVVDISDVTAIQMHIAEMKVLEGDQLTAADVNLDGSVAIDDASILQVFLAETEVAYPIGQWI